MDGLIKQRIPSIYPSINHFVEWMENATGVLQMRTPIALSLQGQKAMPFGIAIVFWLFHRVRY